MMQRGNNGGTDRKSKGKIIAIITITALIALAACNTITPETEEKVEDAEDGYVVDDWGNHESGSSSMDQGREATHADSIRFGLIPPDE